MLMTMTQRRPLTASEEQWRLNLRELYKRKKKQLGLSQEKLADLCDWKSQGTVAQYFTGRTPLNTDAKLKFAKALEEPVTEIDPEMSSFIVERVPQSARTAKEFMDINRETLESMSETDLLKLAGMIEDYVSKNKD